MATRSYILEVNSFDTQAKFDLARNALFREVLVLDLKLSSNKKRLTLKIEEETLNKVIHILDGFGHSVRVIKPGPGGVEGLFF
ncbi:MAG: hypothetical protein HN576_16595 [Bacteriovoracaceae bacterium]|jgi:hypothetical protein|nr:hypothetical protein [Bacteriovoracaceae bacterium]